MAWIELITQMRGQSAKVVGSFGAASIKYSVALPRFFQDKPFTVEANGNVVRYRLNPKGNRRIGGLSVGTQKNVSKCLMEEDQCIYYVDEGAFYISPYSLGKEFLEKFLKKEGII